jgi:phosphopantothenate--cysteine ligase
MRTTNEFEGESCCMNLLVTAGPTAEPIDRVRSITNHSTGRTGAAIALEAHQRGHRVTLLTSRAEAVTESPSDAGWEVRLYRTFDELQEAFASALGAKDFDAVIHSAAVSDYRPAGVFAPAPGTKFRRADGIWTGQGMAKLVDRSAGKVKSEEAELWLRLVKAPKLIDLIRSEWKFTGILVKFKLEAGVAEGQLLEIAEQSRMQSRADLMVANTVEGAAEFAYVGPVAGRYQRVARPELAKRLLDAVERCRPEGAHG